MSSSQTTKPPALIGCHHCETVHSARSEVCSLCGHNLHTDKSGNLQRCWSYLLTGLIFYFPANLLPIMRTTQLGNETDATLAGGVVLLWEHGSWLIAVIIFIASLLVPLAKFLALGGLCLSQFMHIDMSPMNRIRIYRVTEFVGRWSMVDVFVVGFLTALIQMGSLMSITPGPAALAFGAMVVFTMLAANSLDPRIFWDNWNNSHE